MRYQQTVLVLCFLLGHLALPAQQLAHNARISQNEILTPPPGKEPVINGPRVYGARPGKLFVYRIPCQGERPISFKVDGIPGGLEVDEEGIVTGTTPADKGEYRMVVTAENKHGSSRGEFRLVVGDQLVLTPPTGWNSWGGHMINVGEDLVRYAADFMVESGLADVGFQYISLDDCWMKMDPGYFQDNKDGWLLTWGDFDFSAVVGETRDEYGRPVWNRNFTDVRAMTDYVHSMGLKCGLYSSPGEQTCQRFEGSFGYEAVDAKAYADWGFDFLKYDLCGEEIKALKQMSKIIDPESVGEEGSDYAIHQIPIWYPMARETSRQERDILLNLCQYGWQEVETWAPQMGYSTWRMGGDLNHHVENYVNTALKIAVELREYCKPGQWADPDYMYIHFLKNARKKGEDSKEIPLNTNQRYQYVTLWSVISAPFFFSCDLYKIDDFTIRLLSNNEVLNINQDELGHVAKVVRNEHGELILVKDMMDGSKVLAILNTGVNEKEITYSISELGFSLAEVRDVWRKKDIGETGGKIVTKLSGNGVCLYQIKPITSGLRPDE